MSVCKERPATLPPLDAIGLEPVDHSHAMSRGGSGRLANLASKSLDSDKFLALLQS